MKSSVMGSEVCGPADVYSGKPQETTDISSNTIPIMGTLKCLISGYDCCIQIIF
jgi:hypothetical protein